MASLGKIEEFDPKNTNIDHYLDRLKPIPLLRIDVEPFLFQSLAGKHMTF